MDSPDDTNGIVWQIIQNLFLVHKIKPKIFSIQEKPFLIHVENMEDDYLFPNSYNVKRKKNVSNNCTIADSLFIF